MGYLKKRRAEIPRLLLQALCAVGSLAVSLRVRFRTRNCSTSGSVSSPTENAVPSRANMPIEIAPAVAKLEQRGERHVKAIGVSDVNGPAEIAKLSRFSRYSADCRAPSESLGSKGKAGTWTSLMISVLVL